MRAKVWIALGTIYVVGGRRSWPSPSSCATSRRSSPCRSATSSPARSSSDGRCSGTGTAIRSAAPVAGCVHLRWGALPGRPRLAGVGAAGRPVRNRRAPRRDDPAVVRDPGADLHGRAARRWALAGLVLGFAGLALLVDPSGQEGAEPLARSRSSSARSPGRRARSTPSARRSPRTRSWAPRWACSPAVRCSRS